MRCWSPGVRGALRPELGAAALFLWGQLAFTSAECDTPAGFSEIRDASNLSCRTHPRPGSAQIALRVFCRLSDVSPSPLLPPVSLSSAVSHLRGGWRVRPFPWGLEPPGVPFHGRWRLQRRGRTVTARGWGR